jgi:hypothetical protein
MRPERSGNHTSYREDTLRGYLRVGDIVPDHATINPISEGVREYARSKNC